MVAGAPEGWRTTLDKLEKVVVRMQGGAETGVRSVAHATFHLERTYDAPAARVWKALTDEAAKQEWFGGTPGHWELLERHMDVRVGGSERLKGRWAGGVVSTFDATYYDVIPNERLVYSYEMHLDDRKISVSLATMQFEAEGWEDHPDGHRAGRVPRRLRRRGLSRARHRSSPRCAWGVSKGLSLSRLGHGQVEQMVIVA